MLYLYHASHPGNPWGPLPTIDAARKLRAELTEWFCDHYSIRDARGRYVARSHTQEGTP